jgi:hypothetical protein
MKSIWEVRLLEPELPAELSLEVATTVQAPKHQDKSRKGFYLLSQLPWHINIYKIKRKPVLAY